MLSATRLKEVASEQANELEERYPGYRVDLVTRLVEILRKQGEGLTLRRRRPEVNKIVEAFAKESAVKEESD